LRDGERRPGLVEFAVDRFVLLARQVSGDSAANDAPREATALGFKCGDLALGPGDLGFGAATLLVDFSPEVTSDAFLHGFGHTDGGVVVLDGLGGQVALLTAGAFLMAAETEEVQVLAACLSEAQATATVDA
jgi:hypothetical protein